MTWLIGVFGNLLLSVERMRLTAKEQIEYGAEVHLINNEPLRQIPYDDSWYGRRAGVYEAGSATLGRYPVSSASTFADITKLFETDISHLAGAESVAGTSFDFEQVLTSMRKHLGAT